MNTYTRPDNGANVGTNAGIYFINRNEGILNSRHRWVLNKQGRYIVNQYGDVFNCKIKKIKKLVSHPNTNRKGYPRVCIDTHAMTVHKIMLQAWKGPAPSPDYECCHYDDNPNNNSISSR